MRKRCGSEILPGHAIQHIVEAVAIRPENTFLCTLRCFLIREHRNLVRVPVVIVRRRELKVPDERAAGSPQCHGRVGIQVVASPGRGVEDRLRIPHAPNEQVELRIVRPRQPRGRASLAPGVTGPRLAARLAGLGDRHEPPSLPSTIRIVGRDEALTPADHVRRGHTSHDQIAIGQWRSADGVPLRVLSDGHLPLQGARRRGDRDESCVHCSKEDLVVEDGDATIRCGAEFAAEALTRHVVPVRPNLSSGGSVQRRDSAGRLRHEHDPAPHNRRDLDGRGLAVELVNPSEGELVHILTVDLTQGAVAGRPVRAGVGEPVLGRLACRRQLIV